MRSREDDTETPPASPAEKHRGIWPSILYFGTPVALVTTLNTDGTPNIGPMSSAWALGYTVVMGWESTAHTLANLEREGECVINLPGPDLVEQVEALAPLTGRNPPAPHKADTFRYEPHKFQAAGLTSRRPRRPSRHRASRSARCNSRRRSRRSTSPRPAPTASTSGSSRPTSSESTRTRASSSPTPTTSTPSNGVPCSTSSDTTSAPARRSREASALRTDGAVGWG